MKRFDNYSSTQLKLNNDTFDLTQTLFQQVNNEYWREKSNVWNIISAACNDAASEFYTKIRQYVKNLADIDVCTIHNLKSIAKSVDAEHILDFANSLQSFPVQLRELLDILSIKPSKLLEVNQKLYFSSLLPFYGAIDLRSCLYRPQKLSPSLLLDIYNNIDKIQKWFQFNGIVKDVTINSVFNLGKGSDYSNVFLNQAKMYNTNLTEQDDVYYFGFEELSHAKKYNDAINNNEENIEYLDYVKKIELVQTKFEDIIYIKVQDIFSSIKNLKEILDYLDQDKNFESQLSQLLGFEFKYSKKEKYIQHFITNTFTTPSIIVYNNKSYVLNPFFALIELVKSRMYFNQFRTSMVPYYKEVGDNEVTVDMSELCENMISVIKNNDTCYIQNFILFHIYNLFHTKIINDKLKNDFKIDCTYYQNNSEKVKDITRKTYISKYSELTYDEFYSSVSDWISNNELKEFLGQEIEQDIKQITDFKEIQITNKVAITHYNKDYVDFIRYLSLINSITGVKNQQKQRLPYLIYRYNNDIHDSVNITHEFNQYYRKLLGINDDGSYNENNLLSKVAEYLTDICIKISYIRQEIKGLVQQYSFIGTQRIISDVVRDYYVKNFSKRSSWRYISNIFKNKDNSEHLKTVQQLNGINQDDQFKSQIIQYYDQTEYLNIETTLPPTISGYRDSISTVVSTFVTNTDTVSTFILTSDVISTIYDRLGYYIPSSLYPPQSIVTSYTIPAVSVSGTSLYNQLVIHEKGNNNPVNITYDTQSNVYTQTGNTSVPLTEIYTLSSNPISTVYSHYLQTTPTSTRIEDKDQEFKKFCTNKLQMPESGYNQLVGKVLSTVITSQVLTTSYNYNSGAQKFEPIDTATYYSVLAYLDDNTTVSSNIMTTTTGMIEHNADYTIDPNTILSTITYSAPRSYQVVPEQTFTGLIYNPAASSVTIPSGTSVSTILPAGTLVSTEILSTIHTPIWVDGNDMVEKANSRFWEKNLDYLGYNDLSAQISFYEKYFPQLANASTEKTKMEIFKTKVYPLLSSIWDTHATSGFIDGQNNSLQYMYSGKYPGIFPEKNMSNQDFTTIAPLPYIPNLIEINEYDNDDSYIVKPLYDNISYYMNMFMKQMFDMYKIQTDNGFAIAVDGWKQTHIEFKGYCSKYERSANTIATEGQQNSKLDYDGPWVYSSLKAFLGLRDQETNQISRDNIKYFVNNYFFNLTTSKVKENIINKLDRYQQEIFKKGEGKQKLYSFQFDLNDNQYTLFKRKDYFKYEDVGQIWIRMKNFPLSMPLMNRNIVIDFVDVKYANDQFDTLIYNQSGKYANMFKQLTNNAVQFGIIRNVMWILGWTNYIFNNNQRLTFNTKKVLKLVSFKFKPREDFMLAIDPTTVKSYHLEEQNDRIVNFNQFVGVSYKEITDSIDFILHKKGNKFIVFNYNIDKNTVNSHQLIYSQIESPALQIEHISALIDTYNPDPENKVQYGQSYLIDNINDNYIYIGNICHDDYNYFVSGYYGVKQRNYDSIYTQALSTNGEIFKYNLANKLNDSITSVELISTSVDLTTQKEVSTILTTTFKPLYYLNVDPNVKFEDNYATTKEEYANIWRVNADQNNTGIAYEAYNFNSNQENLETMYETQQIDQKYIVSNNILSFTSDLITKQVIDSNNNVIYLNQIKSISSDIISGKFYLDDNDSDYISLQLSYPYCQLNNKNQLCISSLITTLGGYKSLTVNKNENDIYQTNGMKLLCSTIDPVFTWDKENVEQLITDQNSYFYRDGKQIRLDQNLDIYKQIFNNSLTGYYNFYEYYDKYNEAKQNGESIETQKEYLEKYNKSMAKLNDIVAFAPIVNDFIVEPLKIIFNFGNIFNFDINTANPNNTNYFDLDINTYIDTPEEKYKKVGWKCGEWSTDYITWITRDERFGGPEIVTVNLDKYKNEHLTTYTANKTDYSIDIIVNACWFSQSVIQSLNPNIFVNWKGFTYQYIVEDINTNQDCCDYPFLKINVGLNNNTLRCYRKHIIPTCLHNKLTNEKLFGFIRMWEDQITEEKFTEYIKNYSENENTYLEIDATHIVKTYMQFEELCDNKQIAKNMLTVLGIHNNSYVNNLKDSLNWNKTMILKTNGEQLQFHIKNIFI